MLASAAVIAALAYLRDPPWLIEMDSGFRGWEIAEDGTRYRWTDGHASFFVRSDASAVEFPVRTTVSPSDHPVTVSLTIDDRPADRLVLSDAGWHRVRLTLPPRRNRRVLRIDIRVDRTKAGNRGIQVGQLQDR